VPALGRVLGELGPGDGEGPLVDRDAAPVGIAPGREVRVAVHAGGRVTLNGGVADDGDATPDLDTAARGGLERAWLFTIEQWSMVSVLATSSMPPPCEAFPSRIVSPAMVTVEAGFVMSKTRLSPPALMDSMPAPRPSMSRLFRSPTPNPRD
jgi:hypothetical protein